MAGWSPRNYTGVYQGEISLRDALAQSVNTVAARLAAEVGPWKVVRTARRLGIHSKLHTDPSIALGTAEVTLLELTGAYAPFANGGQGVHAPYHHPRAQRRRRGALSSGSVRPPARWWRCNMSAP